MPPPRVVLGTVGRPHGVAGDVAVWLDPDLRDVLVAGLPCTVGSRSLRVRAVRGHRGRPLVSFVGLDTRTAVEALRGLAITVDAAAVPDDDRVWADDLLGREVVDAMGELVGVVDGVLDGAAHDFLVVARSDGAELLVPAVDALVELSDPVVVHGPPGLLDPAEAVDERSPGDGPTP